jgi:hypothetical protein
LERGHPCPQELVEFYNLCGLEVRAPSEFFNGSASLPAEGDPFDESHYLFQMKF